jgi:hypothetical protein
MFDIVLSVDENRFPWSGRPVPLHAVTAEYEAALRWPAVREHLQFLLLPMRDRAGVGSTWLHELCADLPGERRDALITTLSDLRRCEEPSAWAAGLRGLVESGGLDLLRDAAAARPEESADGGSATAYARAILASLVTVTDLLQAESVAVPA